MRRGPVALRYPRGSTDLISESPAPIEYGKAEVLQEGDDITLLAYGPIVSVALDAAKQMAEKGVRATVINARFATTTGRRYHPAVCGAERQSDHAGRRRGAWRLRFGVP